MAASSCARPSKLRATYYDTADLRLARAGASLRFRRGDDEPWTVKLPTDAPGVRNEISMTGPASTPPERLVDLVTAFTRGQELAPVVTLNTTRIAHQLCDRDDRVTVEVVDDSVSVPDGRRVALRFREIEVERKAGKAKLLDRVEVALRDAGATVGEFTPKHVRALGMAALGAPDWPTTADRLPRRPTAAEVVAVAIQRAIGRIVEHDPLVRLRAPVGRDDTAVHQMRVGCRRLRSDLRTFAPLLDRDWTAGLRTELGWLADALGAARDAEVLRARLRRTADLDPLVPLDPPSVAAHRRRPRGPPRGRAAGAGQGDVRGALPPAARHPARRLARTRKLSRHASRLGRGGAAGPGRAAVPAAGVRRRRRGRRRAARARPRPTRRGTRCGSTASGPGTRVDAVATVLGGEAAALASSAGRGAGAARASTRTRRSRPTPGSPSRTPTPTTTRWPSPPGDSTSASARRCERCATAFPAAWRAASRRRLTEWMR